MANLRDNGISAGHNPAHSPTTEKVHDILYENLNLWKKQLARITLGQISPRTFKHFIIGEIQSMKKEILRLLFSIEGENSRLKLQIQSLIAYSATLLDEREASR